MTNKEINMHPDSSPSGGSGVGVRRVNRIPLFIFTALIVMFLLVMIFVASKKANQQHNNDVEETSLTPSNVNSFAFELTNKHQDGIIPSLSTDSTDGDGSESNKNNEKASVNIITPPLPTDIEDGNEFPSLNNSNDSINIERERIDMAKRQIFEQSIQSKTSVDMIAPASSSTSNYSSEAGYKSRNEMLAKIAAVRQKISIQSNTNGDITQVYKQKLEMVQNSGLLDSNIESDIDIDTNTNTNTNSSSSWQLENKVEAPSSPYLLRAGFIIPGTLISGINSELPGQIIAQISRNIYDTATGKHLLIPQGSRLYGFYNSEVAFGQARLMAAWQRITFPDGKVLDIGSMNGSDAGGYGGFHDMVNNHYLRIFGSAVLLSGITAGISYSQDRHNNDDDKSASGAISEALGQQLGQTTVQLINKNMNIAPTIEIRPGYRFNIIVSKDLVFTKPYKSFDY